MDLYHVTSGAPVGLIARTNEQRAKLLRILVAGAGASLLAWCIMPTHVHVILHAAAEAARQIMKRVLAGYARWYNAHRGEEHRLFRDEIEAYPCHDAGVFFTKLLYVHENPLRAGMATLAIDYFWSSARELAGFSLAETVNLRKTLEVLGPIAWDAIDPLPPLADLEPARFPGASPELIRAAAAEAYGLTPGAFFDRERAKETALARALFLKLGQLESYSVTDLAPLAGVKRARAYELFGLEVPERALRIARTLIRTPSLRPALEPVDGSVHFPGGSRAGAA